MLLKIQEPNAQPIALGIDLGTTHSLIGYLKEGQVVLLEEQGEVLLPSAVYYGASTPSIGFEAFSCSKQDLTQLIRSSKRMIGRSDVDNATLSNDFSTEGSSFAYVTRTGKVTPVEVAAEILKNLYQRALKLHAPIKGAVISVPAYFDEAQRVATKQAAELAGIKVLRLIHEPTAAALAYGLETQTNGLCLVIDLGGGTFDVTLLEMDQGVFRVIATGGDTTLGGDDFDRSLAEAFLPKNHPTQQGLLWAKQVKEALTFEESVTVSFQSQAITVNREAFNTIIKPFVKRIIALTQNVLLDADSTDDLIAHVILVGGSTKIPFVQDEIKLAFNKQPLCSLDPDKVVAMGAARHAAHLIGLSDQKSLLLDVLPLSLGLETMGGMVEKIIARNSPIPTSARQTFTTHQDNQSGMVFHIVQGERELVQHNRSLAQFSLKRLPLKPKGAVKVEVLFAVNEEGLLSVTAKELGTGEKAHIEVKPSAGLSDADITLMLQKAIAHADSDMESKRRAQLQLNVSDFCSSLRKALEDPMDWKGDLHALLGALDALEACLISAMQDDLDASYQRCHQLSEPFFQHRLDSSLSKMVQGKTMQQLSEKCQK